MKAAIAGFVHDSIKRVVCLLAFVLLLASMTALAQDPKGSLIITQVYPAGAQTNAAYINDYVEIFNASQNAIDLTNWSIVVGGGGGSDKATAPNNIWIGSNGSYTTGTYTGTPHPMVVNLGCFSSISNAATASICYQNGFNGILQPGQYMLVLVKSKSPVSTTANPLPVPLTPDLDLANIGCSGTTTPCPGANAIDNSSPGKMLSTTSGFVGLVNETITNYTGIGTAACTTPFANVPNAMSDLVGYLGSGTSTKCYAGTAVQTPQTPADGSKGGLWAVWRGGNVGGTNHDCLNSFNNVTDFKSIQIGGIAGYPVDPNWVLHNSNSQTVYKDANGTNQFNNAEFTASSYTLMPCGTAPPSLPPVVKSLTASIPVAIVGDNNGSESETMTAVVTPGSNPTSVYLHVTGDMTYLGGAQNQDFGTPTGPDGNGKYTFTWTGILNTSPSQTLPYANTLKVTASDDQSDQEKRATGTGQTTITVNPLDHSCSIGTGDFWTLPGLYGTLSTATPPAATPQFCNADGTNCTPTLVALVTKGFYNSGASASIKTVTGDSSACGGSTSTSFTSVTGGGTSTASMFSAACTSALSTASTGTYNFSVNATDANGGTCSGSMTFYVGGATNPSVALTASQSSFDQASSDPTSSNVTITATITPGTNPTSTGFTKSKMCFDMSLIGGKTSSCFTDQGQDDKGNEVLTYQGTVPNGPSATLGPLTIPAMTVTDGQNRTGSSSPLVLNINSVPVANPISILVASGSGCSENANNFTLGATGGTTPYAYSVLGQTTLGALSGTAPSLCYAPNAGVTSGSESFQYQVTDAVGTVATGTVNVSITTAPVGSATPNGATVSNTSTLQIALSASGGAGGPYTYTVATQPTLGSLSATTGALPATITYTPNNASVSGSDSFTLLRHR